MNQVFVVICNGETTVYEGEVVENNLVEVHQQIARYATDKMLPNWIDRMLKETKNETP